MDINPDSEQGFYFVESQTFFPGSDCKETYLKLINILDRLRNQFKPAVGYCF